MTTRYRIVERDGSFYPQRRQWFWWESLDDRGTVMSFPSLAATRKHIEAERRADIASRAPAKVHTA